MLLSRHRDDQIESAKQSGLLDQIRETITQELLDLRRGTRETIELEFELDSDEAEQRNLDGDYFRRLR